MAKSANRYSKKQKGKEAVNEKEPCTYNESSSDVDDPLNDEHRIAWLWDFVSHESLDGASTS